MATITYGDGTKINFNGTPSQQDIEDAYNQVKGGSSATPTSTAPQSTDWSKVGNTAANVMDSTVGGGKWAQGLGVALGLGSKDVKAAQASQAQNAVMTQKLIQHAMSYPVGDPRRASELKLAGQNSQQLSGNTEAAAGLSGAPTAKQFLGSAAQLATSAIGSSIPAKGGAGLLRTQSLVGPEGEQVAVKGLQQLLQSRVPQAVAQGLMSGAATGYENSQSPGAGVNAQDLGNIGKSAALTGLTSGAITGLAGLVGKGFNALTNKAPKKLYETSLPLKPSEQEKILYGKMDNPSQTLLDQGVTGSRQQIFNQSQQKVQDLSAQLHDLLTNPDGASVPTKDALDNLAADASKGTPGAQAAFTKAFETSKTGGVPLLDVSQHSPILQDLLQTNSAYLDSGTKDALTAGAAGKVTPDQAYTINQFLGEVIPSSKWNAGSIQESAKVGALKNIYGDLRNQIGPEGSRADDMLNQLQAFLVTRNNAGKTLSKGAAQTPSLGKIVGNIGLGGVGAAGAYEDTHGHKGIGNTLLGAAGIGALAQNPAVATRLAQALKGAGGILNNVDASGKAELARQILRILQSNALGQGFSQPQQ